MTFPCAAPPPDYSVPLAACLTLGLLAGACSDADSHELLTPEEPSASGQASDKILAIERPEDHPLADQWIVVLQDDFEATQALARRVVAGYGGQVRHIYRHALNGFAAVLPRAAVEALSERKSVKYIQANVELMPAQPVSTDSEIPVIANPPWHLDRVDQRSLSLDSMYTRMYTGAGVNLYILDSGIDTDHPEFEGRVYWGMTTVHDNTGIEDCHGHGTAVAGIAGGATLGVANEAYLTIIRINDCEGGASLDDQIAGFDWIAADDYPTPSVANLSYGYDYPWYAKEDALNDAVENVVAGGVPVVVSAANDGKDACDYSPAKVEEAITVGATSKSDAIWQLPDLLGDAESNSGPCLDIWAPGDGILTANLGGDSTFTRGTSYAAPMVAGAVALLLEDDGTRTPAQISQLLDGLATRKTISGALDGSPNRILYAPYYNTYTGGPLEVESGNTYEWYPVLYGGGGYAPDSYEWWYTPDGGSPSLVATTETYTRYISDGDPDFTLFVVTTIASVTDTATAKGVDVDPYEDPCVTQPELPCQESVIAGEGG